MNTQEKILDKALEMFNERGVEYVGLRELAAVLEMRVSNITYYFPTKDDLVYQLSLELNRLNSEVIVEAENMTPKQFLEMLHVVFQNQVRYRCLLLSFVHLMEQNKIISARYKKTENTRFTAYRSNIEAMHNAGYLKLESEDDVSFLVSSISLIGRFWISEAAVSFRHLKTEEQMRHYLFLVGKLLQSHASAKGRKEIQLFFEAL
jgi:AcrR family transcriptional regulator